MLLNTLLAIHLLQVPNGEPTWTGEVRAFTGYAGPQLLPGQRVNTCFVAKKVYSDGRTVTILRTERAPTLGGALLVSTGEGRSERSAKGRLFMARYLYSFPSLAHATFNSSFQRFMAGGRQAVDAFSKRGELASHLREVPPNEMIDPLEAVAFGTLSPGDDWNFPAPEMQMDRDPGYFRHFALRNVGMHRVYFGKSPQTLCVFTLDMRERIPNSRTTRKENYPGTNGNVLFYPDGRLAAFQSMNLASADPSLAFLAPGQASENLKMRPEVPGDIYVPYHILYVPVEVPPGLEKKMLEEIKPSAISASE